MEKIKKMIVKILTSYGFKTDGTGIYELFNGERSRLIAVLCDDRICFELWNVNGSQVRLGTFYYSMFDEKFFKIGVKIAEFKTNINCYVNFLNA